MAGLFPRWRPRSRLSYPFQRADANFPMPVTKGT